jgi:glycine/sarcosine N-methyltransferase
MADFYSSILKYYDDIFPLNEKQVSFVSGEFANQNSRLLEVGCANGKLTDALSNYPILGVDLEKSFIDIAQARYKDIDFKALDMRQITSLNQTFDGIVCFGNTLVHISESQVERFVFDCYKMLNKGGKLLIQILNYAYIIDDHIDTLPLIDNEKIQFVRKYDHGEQFLFNTDLTIKAEGKTLRNSIELCPIRKETLSGFVKKAGFKSHRIYSGFNKSPFSETALPLVMCCEK